MAAAAPRHGRKRAAEAPPAMHIVGTYVMDGNFPDFSHDKVSVAPLTRNHWTFLLRSFDYGNVVSIVALDKSDDDVIVELPIPAGLPIDAQTFEQSICYPSRNGRWFSYHYHSTPTTANFPLNILGTNILKICQEGRNAYGKMYVTDFVEGFGISAMSTYQFKKFKSLIKFYDKQKK